MEKYNEDLKLLLEVEDLLADLAAVSDPLARFLVHGEVRFLAEAKVAPTALEWTFS
jgi:hypothetical protein